MATIEKLRDEYRFLSNFWETPAAYDGVLYPTAEHAYQAAKTTDPQRREMIRQAPRPFDAKMLGAEETVPEGWAEGGDVCAMADVVSSKFRLNPPLADLLMATGSDIIIEGNHWHDNNWGNCSCGGPQCAEPGRNKLGQVLMTVRAGLQAERRIGRPMTPVRVIRSVAGLAAVAADSLICPAWDPATVYQAGADGRWVEPGTEDDIPTPALWEFLTGSHDALILEEDREVWVLWDAAARVDAPPRAPGTPDWAVTLDGNGGSFESSHQDRSGAEAELSGAAAGMVGRLWHRAPGKFTFRRFYE